MVRGSINKEESVNMGEFYLLCFVPLQNGRSKKHRRSRLVLLKNTNIKRILIIYLYMLNGAWRAYSIKYNVYIFSTRLLKQAPHASERRPR